jgi:hypothetical protein
MRTVGRTAVIAGTASAVSGRVANRQQQKMAQQHEPPAGAVQLSQPPVGNDLVVRLQQLADMRASGLLSDKEFAAAKARVLQA